MSAANHKKAACCFFWFVALFLKQHVWPIRPGYVFEMNDTLFNDWWYWDSYSVHFRLYRVSKYQNCHTPPCAKAFKHFCVYCICILKTTSFLLVIGCSKILFLVIMNMVWQSNSLYEMTLSAIFARLLSTSLSLYVGQ